ncbi:outer membrane beta-barrel protein [Bradyrhizobium sp. CB1650]|uniref:outer membrane beta-barrel protein n=1 Tax=Bradyrhizobium sp. CB1650 TaxID=3039153 RepID=UPI00243482CE|nr:outer membrane beta-barrel protein [Bradyrhizobium sp. CB1650]WGD50864.1 outer membrane beta-barrel protein [Bradyrhizobium sp. CB1650]
MRSDVLFYCVTTAALVAGGAVNSADLKPAAKIPPALWSWTGGYIGGHIGGGYGRTLFSDPYGPSLYGDVVDTPVFLAGGQIGYNWQRERWVFGVELDASRAVSDGINTCLAVSSSVVSANCNASPSVFVTGTGRLGYAFGPQGHTLAYLKGGVAWQHNRGDVANNNEFSGRAPQNATHFDYGDVGGTIGVGVEQALTPAWSLTLEYDYLRFGGPNVATPPTLRYPPLATVPANVTSLSSSYHVGKLGLNYHFDADPWTPAWSDAPLYPTKPTVSASPIALADGWSLESGTRLWLSRGRYQWDSGGSDLVSRLSYHGLDGISGELFERVDSPWGIFLKGNIGVGRFNTGNMNDEDWGLRPPYASAPPIAYVNTISGQANGRFTYYTADAGYNFLRGSTYKVGGFMGWSYYGQKSDSIGCVQIAAPKAHPCLAPGDRRVIGSQDTDWNALRIGLSAETMLLDRWRVSADVAYLPWTDFHGRDNHLLRSYTKFTDQRGSDGSGVQVEAVLSYFITENFSVGVGGRYWAMWTPNDRKGFATEATEAHRHPVTRGPFAADHRMERWGTFLQASYKFD